MPEKSYEDINLYDIVDSMIYGFSGEVGVVLELKPKTDLRMCSYNEHEPGALNFRRALGALPEGFGVMFDAEIIPSNTSETQYSEGEVSQLVKEIVDEKKQAHLQSGKTVRYYAYLWVMTNDSLRLKLFPALRPTTKKIKKATVAKNQEKLLQALESFRGGLSSLGVESKLLNQEESSQRYWSLLSPEKARTISPPSNKNFSLRSQLAASNTWEKKEYYAADGLYHAAVSFYEYPDDIELGMVDSLLETLPIGSRYVLTVLTSNKEAHLDRLKKQHQSAVSLGSEAQGKNSKDYEAEAQMTDLDELISRCRNDDENIYIVSATIVLRSSDKNDVLKWKKELENILRQEIGVRSIVEDCLHRRVVLSTLPMQGHLTPRRNLLLGSTIYALAPLSHAWRGTETPGLTVFGPTGEPIQLSLFENKTPQHGFICASTGSGKSFTANMLLLSLIADPKMRAMILDVGGSYRRPCEILDGAYFDVSIDEKYAINPILPRSEFFKEDGTIDPETLAAQASLLAKIAKIESGAGRIVLERALKKSFSEKEEPLLKDIYEIIEKEPWEEALKGSVGAILSEMVQYVEGAYSILLSRPSRVRAFEKSMTVFDLAGLKEHPALVSVLIAVIQFSLNRNLNDKSIRKVIIVDEGWEFFAKNSTASTAKELVEKLFRQARKQNTSVIAISQSPMDIINSPIGDAVRTNTQWVMGLQLSTGYENLSHFGFTDQAIDRAKNMAKKDRAYSECLIRYRNEPNRIVRISPSSLEYWIATTNAEETAQEQKHRDENGLTILQSLKDMAKKEPVISW